MSEHESGGPENSDEEIKETQILDKLNQIILDLGFESFAQLAELKDEIFKHPENFIHLILKWRLAAEALADKYKDDAHTYMKAQIAVSIYQAAILFEAAGRPEIKYKGSLESDFEQLILDALNYAEQIGLDDIAEKLRKFL